MRPFFARTAKVEIGSDERRSAQRGKEAGLLRRFWLATTPALPEPAAQAARAKATERYEAFVAALGRRLAKGPKLRQEISEDVNPTDDSAIQPWLIGSGSRSQSAINERRQSWFQP